MTIAEDNFSPHARWRSSTVPTNEGNYENNIKKSLAFLTLRRYRSSSSLADIDYVGANSSGFVKMSSRDRLRPQAALSFTSLVSVIVILGAVVGQILNPESVLFPIIAAFGLSVLATIVLAHQQ